MTTMRAGAACALFGLLAGFTPQQASAAEADDAAPLLRLAKFEHERASHDVRYVANWVVHSGDNRTGYDHGLPFVIIDKKDARVYVFDGNGRLRGAAPALLGMGIGDTALPGIGARELSNIAPKDRVTQAGRRRLARCRYQASMSLAGLRRRLAMHGSYCHPKDAPAPPGDAHRSTTAFLGMHQIPANSFGTWSHDSTRPGHVYVLPEPSRSPTLLFV